MERPEVKIPINDISYNVRKNHLDPPVNIMYIQGYFLLLSACLLEGFTPPPPFLNIFMCVHAMFATPPT